MDYRKDLRSKMAEKNISITLLAKRLGVTRESVYRWLNGKCLPTEETQKRINEVLELENKYKPPITILPAQAAEVMGISLPTLYRGMRAGRLPIGSAWQNAKRWTYLISPELLKNYVGERAFNSYFYE